MSNHCSKMCKKRISVSITEETEAELLSYAQQENVKMSWVLRKALVEFLGKNLKQRELPVKFKDQ